MVVVSHQEIYEAIKNNFDSFEKFKSEFSKVTQARFGSGWAWLCVKENGLYVCSTAN